jgi:hypothetical protein
MSFADVVRRLEQALEGAAKLGINPRSDRFERYLAVLRDAAALSYPQIDPRETEPEQSQLLFEAGSQAFQPIAASELWPILPPNLAKTKVRKVLAGYPLPDPRDEADRQSRDVLLEFTLAHLLRLDGAKITTAGEEDVCAAFEGHRALMIECKRPAALTGLRTAFRKGEAQLRLRTANAGWGVLAIGIDRFISDVPSIPIFDTGSHVPVWADGVLRQYTEEILAIDRANGGAYSNARPAKLVAVVLTLPVFVMDEGLARFAQFLVVSNLGPPDAELRALAQRIVTRPGE